MSWIKHHNFVGLICLLLCGLSANTSAVTFTVTSNQCTGPGSLTEAIGLANIFPGADVISMTSNLVIDATTCPAVPHDPKDYFMLVASDDLTIEGNNAQLKGSMSWVDSAGRLTPISRCPNGNPNTIIINRTPGFIKLAPDVNVVVENLRLFELNAIAYVQQQASLELQNVEAQRILTTISCGSTSAIKADEGASVTIRDNIWSQVINWGFTLAGVVSVPAIDGLNAKSLVIENSRFLLGDKNGGFIGWQGSGADSKMLIVSSEMSEVGGIIAVGDTRSQIVNSVWATSAFGEPAEGERIINQSSQPMTIEASTLLFNEGSCNIGCQRESGLGRILHFGPTAAPIELIDTAIATNFPVGAFPGALLESVQAAPPAFSANSTTWIQPIDGQDGNALRSITNQPALMTTGAGFSQPFAGFDARLWATPLSDGVLIDTISQANCAAGNQLTNPIDLSCITLDLLGNPRVDGNGRRNIGAIQTTLAPHLAVSNVADGRVSLSWTRPHDPDTGALTGYEICHGTGAPPDPVGIGTACPGSLVPFPDPSTLTGDITGLTNGTVSWFLVRGINPGAGPWSNLVSAAPVTVPGIPGVTATPGDGMVSLSWTTPATDGGSAIAGYIIYYREVGSASWMLWPSIALVTSTNVGGLVNGVDYEFRVSAFNAIGAGAPGTTGTTPQAPLFLQYATPVEIVAGAGSLQLYPTYGNVVGTASYKFIGTPPNWLSLNADSGVVTLTNPPPMGSDYTQYVTVELSRFGPPAGSVTATIQIEVRQAGVSPYLNYLDYQGPAGTAVAITPTVFGLTAPYAYSISSANLPPGLTLNDPATGVIVGTPTTVGFWDITMQVEDSLSQLRNDVVFITIKPTLAYPSITGTVGSSLSVLPVVPPIQPGRNYTYALSGSLPPGLNFNTSTGEISGTPTTSQSSVVDVTISTPLPTVVESATTHVSLAIASYPIDFSYPSGSLPLGQPFTLFPSINGTIGAVSFSAEHPLPHGLTLNPATGAISGIMTRALIGKLAVIKLTDEFSSAVATLKLQASEPAPIPLFAPLGLLSLLLLMLGSGFIGIRKFARM